MSSFDIVVGIFFMVGLHVFIFLLFLAKKKENEIISPKIINYFIFGVFVYLLVSFTLFWIFGIWPDLEYLKGRSRPFGIHMSICIIVSSICSSIIYATYLYKHNISILKKSPETASCLDELLKIEKEINRTSFFIIKKEVVKVLIDKGNVIHQMKELGLDSRGLSYLLMREALNNMLPNLKGLFSIFRKDLTLMVYNAVDELEKLGHYSKEAAEQEKALIWIIWPKVSHRSGE